jgi:hypothetical protein
VPADADRERWNAQGREADAQAQLINVLRQGSPDRVMTVPWDDTMRKLFRGRTAELAEKAAFDVRNMREWAATDPNTPAQYMTRLFLQDREDEKRDELLVRGMMRGLPDRTVEVVAAYGTAADFQSETGLEEADDVGLAGTDLLGATAGRSFCPLNRDVPVSIS